MPTRRASTVRAGRMTEERPAIAETLAAAPASETTGAGGAPVAEAGGVPVAPALVVPPSSMSGFRWGRAKGVPA